MNISDFSKEQFELICFSNSKINIAHGPVRSGKNFAENIRIYKYLIQEPKDNIFSPIVFAGVSQNAVYRNILQDLFKLIGKNNYSYKENKGKGTVFGRDFYVFGFKDCDDVLDWMCNNSQEYCFDTIFNMIFHHKFSMHLAEK